MKGTGQRGMTFQLGCPRWSPSKAPLLLKGCVTLGKLATSLSLRFLISEMGDYSLHILVR